MSDLLSVLKQAQIGLAEASSVIKKAKPTSESIKVQRIWLGRANLHEDLLKTQELLGCRAAAMKNLEDLRNIATTLGSSPLSDIIGFGAVQMPLYAARLLSVDCYLASTWSVYDRLANVAGRLMADVNAKDQNKKGSSPNPSRNPKLVEDLIDPKGCFQGFGINEILLSLYGEPIYASYFLRNSFMHDGGMMNNVPILSGSSAAACFCVSQENAEMLNNAVAKRFGIACSGVFKEGDIVSQLKALHEELDKMFAALIEFVVGSCYSQLSLFGERICVNLSATAIL